MAFRLIDPGAKKDYTLSWSDWLDGGVNIASFTWSILPTGPTLGDITDATPQSTVYVSGCTQGVVYELTCTIVTDKAVPQTDDRSITLRCEE